VLEKGASEWSSEWNDFALGRYTAQLVAAYGTSNRTVAATTVFWVIPWMVMTVGIIVIAAILLILTLLIRSYNRHIINKYARGKYRKS
jgi:hypothetical protein